MIEANEGDMGNKTSYSDSIYYIQCTEPAVHQISSIVGYLYPYLCVNSVPYRENRLYILLLVENTDNSSHTYRAMLYNKMYCNIQCVTST